MSLRRSLALATPLAGLLATSAMAGSASAATTQTFGCRASVARVTALAGGVTVEPYVANPTGGACATDSAGVSSATPLNLGTLGATLGTITVGPADASTTSTATDTALGASALVSVNAVSVPTAAGAVSIVGPAQVSASYACVDGAVDAASSSTLSAIQIGSHQITFPSGQLDAIPLDEGLLGQIGTVTVNQNTSTATSNTETLLTVSLNGVATIVVGEAAVTQPASGACSGLTPSPNPTPSPSPSPSPSPDPSPSPSPNPSPNPSPSPTPASCPAGTTLDATGTMCDLDGTGGATTGIVVAPADDITGASVISLTTARRLYGSRTACLNGAGPKFVVVGTRAADRITVSKVRMRVLGLGGNDAITVRGGNGTCVNGGAGNDTIANRQRNRVTVFGANGNDRITIGNGAAYVLGGLGKDRIVAGNGRVNLQGNGGADDIRAGNGPDILNGGSGNDVLIAGTGRAHLNGGPGDNTMTAHGKVAFVKAGKGHSVAYVQRADMGYARHHGVASVHAIS